MATQSLYRRYRPRRFAEVKGQDHVVRALRDAVAGGREGQAYLFSGPRGTGKTTSARILAKALNCERVVDGEPCCECESCLAVERGTSYDVHELDAASNNGVDAIRDLIEKASLGTPGRHKVYILDEVHMLSKPAEAALLKTLEEPPPHVVFVLATTDPQKMSDTIRSRTQHLQFHLLPTDTLAEHVRWVASDAGYDLPQAAFDAALAQGGGSARDTLSALELIAASGGEVDQAVDLDEFLLALVEHDAGRALTAMAHAITLGRDARTVTEDLVRHLRNAFLSLMAPELVVLHGDQIDALAANAQRLGAPALVRAIERLGASLVDLRNAPDPRVLVEVVLVQLTHPAAGSDIEALAARLERLEQRLKDLGDAPAAARPPAGPSDPTTGRAVLGGAARRPDRAAAAPGADASAGGSAATPSAGAAAGGSAASAAARSGSSRSSRASESDDPAPGRATGSCGSDRCACDAERSDDPAADDPPAAPTRPAAPAATRSVTSASPGATEPPGATAPASGAAGAGPSTAPASASGPAAANPSTAPTSPSGPAANPSTAPTSPSGPAANPSTAPTSPSGPSAVPGTAPTSPSGPAAAGPSMAPASPSGPSAVPSTAPTSPSGPAANPGTAPTSPSGPAANPGTAPTSPSGPSAVPSTAPTSASGPAAAGPSTAPASATSVVDAWERQLKSAVTPPLARALFAAGSFAGGSGERWRFEVPSAAHAARCEPHRAAVEAQLAALVGHPVTIELVAATGEAPSDGGRPGPAAAVRPTAPATPAIERARAAAATAPAEPEEAVAAATAELEPDDEVDLSELTDAPPESVKTPLDHLTEAFPGSELIADD